MGNTSLRGDGEEVWWEELCMEGLGGRVAFEMKLINLKVRHRLNGEQVR